MPLEEAEYVQGVNKKRQETVKQGYVGATSASYLKTDTISSELFLEIWNEPASLKPHAPECAFPQNICADGLIKDHLSAFGYCNDKETYMILLSTVKWY